MTRRFALFDRGFRRLLLIGAGWLTLAFALAAPAVAQPVFGVTGGSGQQRLVRFDSQTPGTIDLDLAITGLQAGEVIHGIDFIPGFPQDVLYALGSTSRLYTINPGTGVATQGGTGTFTPALSGTRFGFEADGDGPRAFSDADQNLSIDAGTGAATAGADLAYAAGDPNDAADPNVVGAGTNGQ